MLLICTTHDSFVSYTYINSIRRDQQIIRLARESKVLKLKWLTFRVASDKLKKNILGYFSVFSRTLEKTHLSGNFTPIRARLIKYFRLGFESLIFLILRNKQKKLGKLFLNIIVINNNFIYVSNLPVLLAVYTSD